MYSTPFGNGQPENTPYPILVTLSGMDIEVSPHWANALLPMLVTLPGIVTDLSFLQYWNAPSSMLVTPLDMYTESSIEQDAKAAPSIPERQ